MKRVFVRGANYFVDISGEGEPLLLLHGFTGDYTTWNEVAPYLPNCQCVKVDLLGHGQTTSPVESSRYAMEEVARDLYELLQQLGYESVHVLGYSMGGRLALSFAMTYPNKVKSLILESSSPGLKTDEERSARRKVDENLASFILSEGIEAFVDYWENISLFETQKSLPKERRKQIRFQRLQNDPVGLANSLKGMGTGMQPSFWGRLHELSMPVLIICGELDVKFCRIGQQMMERLPSATLNVIPNVGHAVHVEHSQIFGKIVSEFIFFKAKMTGSGYKKEDNHGN